MSIVSLSKVTLVGLAEEKAELLEQLQKLGCLHIIPLATPRDELGSEISDKPDEFNHALKYLLNCPRKHRQIKNRKSLDAKSIVQEINWVRDKERTLLNRKDHLLAEREKLRPFGQFEVPAEQELGGHRLWFYKLPHYRLKEVVGAELVWQVVARDHTDTYLVVIAEREPVKEVPAASIQLIGASMVQLEEELEEIDLELDSLALERESLTRWILLLQWHLEEIIDQTSRSHVAKQTLDTDDIFALQGWVPTDQHDSLYALSREKSCALLIEEPDETDKPPTLLKNPEALAGGQEVVNFYQVPGYRSWDPSRVVFFSFALFFGLILSDAGYGLLLGIMILFFWNKMGENAKGKRLQVMAAALGGMTLLCGVFAGSYFGEAPPFTWLEGLQLYNVNDFDAMMHLCIVIGVGHVVLANAVILWQHRGLPSMGPPAGWIAILCGGLGYWLTIDDDGIGSPLFFPALMIAGCMLILLFSSNRGWSRPSDWLWRLLEGLLALSSLSKAFGDVLSYLRLFALGLAGASLAITFNHLASQVAESVPGIGILLQVLILILGHLLNFVLAVVSGVIHGLRLNLIEFYNWSLSDEGYAFQPFVKQEVTPWKTP